MPSNKEVGGEHWHIWLKDTDLVGSKCHGSMWQCAALGVHDVAVEVDLVSGGWVVIGLCICNLACVV